MDAKQHKMAAANTINELESRGQEIEITPLRGNLAQILGSETAAFYEKAGLCCDD
jgi:hypothetical protein